jgi:hypothetical protein
LLVKRREFITLLGGAAAALPLPVNAQPSAKIPRIGLMVTGSLDSPEARVQLDAFRQGLDASWTRTAEGASGISGRPNRSRGFEGLRLSR